MKRVLTSIGKGLVDCLPIVSTVKHNVNDALGGTGSPDIIRLLTCIGGCALMVALAAGKISPEQALHFFSFIK